MDSEFKNTGWGNAGESRMHEAELRVFVMRAATQVEQTFFPLMDDLLNDLQLKIERSRSNAERQQLSDAFVSLHKRKPAIQAQFSKALRELIEHDLAPMGSVHKQTIDQINVTGLSIVDDEQMAEEIEAKRTSMKIETSCEWEFREVTSLINSLQGLAELDQLRNPVRPEILSRCLHRALQGTVEDSSTRRLLENAAGDALSRAMPQGYRKIAEDLKRRNVKPLDYTTRASIGTGYILGLDTGPTGTKPLEQTLLEEATQEAQAVATLSLTQSLQNAMSAVFGLVAQVDPGGSPAHARPHYTASSPEYADSGFDFYRGVNSQGTPSSQFGPSTRGGPVSRGGPDSVSGWSSSLGPASRRGPNSRLSDMLLDLRGKVWGAPTDVRSVSVRNARGFGDSGFADSTRSARSFASTEPFKPSSFGPMNEGAMLNPVKANLTQLQDATQEPYRLTIEIVALLFDALLLDKGIQPLVARLIARLQLPMLDVALSDPNLFVRPEHPLHALINRLGNTGAAFDVYESGPGQRFYAAALTIVEEILEGEFQALETYRSALDKLNAFIKNEASADNPFHADAARMLSLKETSLLLEQHLSQQVVPLIQEMPIQPFLKDFFLKTWVRAQVEAVLRYGEKSPESHRYSRMCSDLVWSVQPKQSVEEKRQLVAALPHLMRDVNEAFELLKWPPLAQKEFRARLIELQARAMKSHSPSDDTPISPETLDPDAGRRAIMALKSLAVPSLEELHANALSIGQLDTSQCTFYDLERSVTGYLSGDEVMSSSQIDLPLFDVSLDKPQVQAEPEPKAQSEEAFPSLDDEIALEKNRSMLTGEAYEIRIAEVWRKMRLAWVTDMRSFYLFEDCAEVKRKCSLSSQTLMQLWSSDGIRLFEKQPLMARCIESTKQELLSRHPQELR